MPFPETKLWELLKPLKSKNLQIFTDHQDVDNDKKPNMYIVIQDQIFDEPELFGDGITIIREASFEIYINARKKSDARSIYNSISTILSSNEISFTLNGNIYDNQSQYYTMTIEGQITYHE